jgi:hypothetical protein
MSCDYICHISSPTLGGPQTPSPVKKHRLAAGACAAAPPAGRRPGQCWRTCTGWVGGWACVWIVRRDRGACGAAESGKGVSNLQGAAEIAHDKPGAASRERADPLQNGWGATHPHANGPPNFGSQAARVASKAVPPCWQATHWESVVRPTLRGAAKAVWRPPLQ